MGIRSGLFRATAIASAVATFPVAQEIVAQQETIEEVLVTATRRSESIQNVPINITALSGDMLEQQGLSNLAEMSRRVAGMTLVDQGPRGADLLTVRGLNVNSLNASEFLNNTSGDTVGIYVGEIPLYIDLKLNDLERVEVLRGPQGTLYGAGTLGGAVRYIPRKPQSDAFSLSLRGNAYNLDEADDLGYEGGVTVNLPLVENRLALRASLDFVDDPGFIDYNYLVREPGVSNPQPDFSDPLAVQQNLRREDDANNEDTLSGRLALRYTGDRLDATLSYYYQNMDVGARQINHKEAFGTGEYESAHRFVEPSERQNELLSLELVADLGFAELTSATGYSEYEENSRRDQTDLLLTFGPPFTFFPELAAYATTDAEEERFNQELRLVSTGDGPFSWIIGAFYNDFETYALAREYTPGFDRFLVDIGIGGQLRPDSLEYYSPADFEQEEMALYGEISYRLTDAWEVTLGGRVFDYDLKARVGAASPLFETVFEGAPQDQIAPFIEENDTGDDGQLFKFNTSYTFNDDLMAFMTVSEGFRLGGVNTLQQCSQAGGNAAACLQPNEVLIKPDTTTNYEIGLHSGFGASRLDASIFYIDWQDIQLQGFSSVGSFPIIVNGGEARSMGLELSGEWLISDQLVLTGAYSYTKAELTEDAPGLVGENIDAQDGDQLPGIPEHQGSVMLSYTLDMPGGSEVDLNWAMTANSDVLTKVGEKAFGEQLDGYALHNVWASWYRKGLTLTLYADNVLDEYAETGVRDDVSRIGQVEGIGLRRYFKNVVRPREIGLRVNYRLGD